MHSRLILASTSKYRMNLMQRVGFVCSALSPGYEEHAVTGMDPRETVKMRAQEKARCVAREHGDAWVIGSDQGLIFEGELLGKGGNEQGAFLQLQQLSGHEAVLATALCVIGPGVERLELDEQFLGFRSMGHDFIRRYLAFDKPFDCAGSFKIESAGPALFTYIRGEDPTAIEGLPMMRLVRILAEYGIEPTL